MEYQRGEWGTLSSEESTVETVAVCCTVRKCGNRESTRAVSGDVCLSAPVPLDQGKFIVTLCSVGTTVNRD